MIKITVQEEQEKQAALEEMREWLTANGMPDEATENLPPHLRHYTADLWKMVKDNRKISQIQARQLAAAYRSGKG